MNIQPSTLNFGLLFIRRAVGLRILDPFAIPLTVLPPFFNIICSYDINGLAFLLARDTSLAAILIFIPAAEVPLAISHAKAQFVPNLQILAARHMSVSIRITGWQK